MLKIEKIKKTYHQTQVLDDVNLEIQTGEIVSILGQPGSGKSTLLNIILGLEEATEGKLFFKDK